MSVKEYCCLPSNYTHHCKLGTLYILYMGTNCTGKLRVMDVASDETGIVEKAGECDNKTESSRE